MGILETLYVLLVNFFCLRPQLFKLPLQISLLVNEGSHFLRKSSTLLSLKILKLLSVTCVFSLRFPKHLGSFPHFLAQFLQSTLVFFHLLLVFSNVNLGQMSGSKRGSRRACQEKDDGV
jgi:hypothetical protein